ncbi:transglycosylase SLT domain-containing protein [Streptomyces sp. NPDC127098]|uniref:transglycosylase SLT domain-containing protein n=1 Tax=Streptomyces sp. NPDC127098 TaxID=3347137 RepID=UPI003662920F
MPAITTTATATALRRRPARVACLAAASAAVAVSLTLPAHASERPAEATASTQEVTQQVNESTTRTAVEKATDNSDKQADKQAEDPGRGAEFDDDGKLIPIAHHEQPDPVPASREDIDKWIKEALKVMDKNDIPGSYQGIYSNLMRESSGDPYTINMWDTNAHKNIPSKGLLQVIDPTFEQYHVDGTKKDIYDPVANIVAACNYAADKYGSMDNVNSAY